MSEWFIFHKDHENLFVKLFWWLSLFQRKILDFRQNALPSNIFLMKGENSTNGGVVQFNKTPWPNLKTERVKNYNYPKFKVVKVNFFLLITICTRPAGVAKRFRAYYSVLMDYH